MTESLEEKPQPISEPQHQIPGLKEFLKSLNAARKLLAMYGESHPNTMDAAEALTKSLEEFLARCGRSTFVFTKEAVVVNDSYSPSNIDAQELFRRLRVRGVMAITFTDVPPSEQIRQFLFFLNTDPREVRQQGGPVEYLHRLGVTRIVATAAIYSGSDEAEGDTADEHAAWDPANMDQAVCAVIDWLARQDKAEDDDDCPRLPISQIMSSPDMAAKLIREAVTKLHNSRKEATSQELVGEVVQDLKDLATDDPEQWDKRTTQVRKAISKLPADMRPVAPGFLAETSDKDQPELDSRRLVDASEAEDMVARALKNRADVETNDAISVIGDLQPFFTVKTAGPNSHWRRELEPTRFVASSGRTLSTLMKWENSATEHGRIAHALASLISKTLEMGDMESTLAFTEQLTQETKQTDDTIWRSANARSALLAIEPGTLKKLVGSALKAGSYQAKDVATSLIEAIPSLALPLIDLLGVHPDEPFNEALKRGISQSGLNALPQLSGILRYGSTSTRKSALETLMMMGSVSAIGAIGDAMEATDAAFNIEALEMLSAKPNPLIVEICVKALSHREKDVRIAATNALGKMDDESATPHVRRIAMRRTILDSKRDERIAAIRALALIGSGEDLKDLDRIAKRRPIFGRAAYQVVRDAASQAAARIRDREEKGVTMAA